MKPEEPALVQKLLVRPNEHAGVLALAGALAQDRDDLARPAQRLAVTDIGEITTLVLRQRADKVVLLARAGHHRLPCDQSALPSELACVAALSCYPTLPRATDRTTHMRCGLNLMGDLRHKAKMATTSSGRRRGGAHGLHQELSRHCHCRGRGLLAGAGWYMAFGKTWTAALAITPEDAGRQKRPGAYLPLILRVRRSGHSRTLPDCSVISALSCETAYISRPLCWLPSVMGDARQNSFAAKRESAPAVDDGHTAAPGCCADGRNHRRHGP
jgi:hypothetical protein